jgi:hypothetical protein
MQRIPLLHFEVDSVWVRDPFIDVRRRLAADADADATTVIATTATATATNTVATVAAALAKTSFGAAAVDFAERRFDLSPPGVAAAASAAAAAAIANDPDAALDANGGSVDGAKYAFPYDILALMDAYNGATRRPILGFGFTLFLPVGMR